MRPRAANPALLRWTLAVHGATTEPDAVARRQIVVPVPAHTAGPATIACADYLAHQSAHRRLDDGWICDRCATQVSV